MKKKIKKFGKGGQNKPIITNNPKDPRIQAYNDSLDLYNQSSKIKRVFPESPKINKEEFEKLRLKNKSLTNYEFDEAKYREDKKIGKAINTFDDYIYSAPDSSIREHPRYIANQEYGVKYKGDSDVNKFSSEGVDKYAITLKDGSIKEPGYLYNGKPEWSDYNIFSPDRKTQRMYYQGYDGKPELQNIFSQTISPVRTDYFGKDSLIEAQTLGTSSKSTGWYKKGDKPTFKETSSKVYKNYYVPVESVDVYEKPVQPYIYKKEVIPTRNKEQPIQINNINTNSLPTWQPETPNMEHIDRFPKGTYFTRPRQGQELNNDQFGRQGKTDMFDKKTGKLIGTMKNGGKIKKLKKAQLGNLIDEPTFGIMDEGFKEQGFPQQYNNSLGDIMTNPYQFNPQLTQSLQQYTGNTPQLNPQEQNQYNNFQNQQKQPYLDFANQLKSQAPTMGNMPKFRMPQLTDSKHWAMANERFGKAQDQFVQAGEAIVEGFTGGMGGGKTPKMPSFGMKNGGKMPKMMGGGFMSWGNAAAHAASGLGYLGGGIMQSTEALLDTAGNFNINNATRQFENDQFRQFAYNQAEQQPPYENYGYGMSGRNPAYYENGGKMFNFTQNKIDAPEMGGYFRKKKK